MTSFRVCVQKAIKAAQEADLRGYDTNHKKSLVSAAVAGWCFHPDMKAVVAALTQNKTYNADIELALTV